MARLHRAEEGGGMEARTRPDAGLRLFLVLIIIGMVACDLPWQERLGTQTRSLMIFVAPLAFLRVLPTYRPWRSGLARAFGTYALLTLLTSVVMLMLHLVQGGALAVNGRNLVSRTVTSGYENITFFMAATALAGILARLPVRTTERAFVATFAILTGLALLEMASKEPMAWAHGTSSAFKADFRLSLLTSEPSQALPTYTAFYLATMACFLRAGRSRLLLAATTAVYLWVAQLIGSKGGLPIFVAAMIVPAFWVSAAHRKTVLKGAVLAAPVVAYLAVAYTTASLPNLQKSIDTFTSVGTRASGFLSAFLVLLQYPFGTGYGTFFVHYPPILLDAANRLTAIFSLPLNLEEIYFMTSTLETLSAKAGIPTQIAYNGITAIWFFGHIFRRAWCQTKNLRSLGLAYILRGHLAFMLLTLLFGADINTLFVYLIPLAVLEAGIYRLPKQTTEAKGQLPH